MTTTDVLEPAAVRRAVPRLSGIDVARAVAMLGMFVVHLDLAGQGFAIEGGPPAQQGFTVVRFFEGRAMPLFVLLSGVGLTLLLRTRGGRPAAVVGRAGVLLLLGVLLSGRSGGVAIILHFYALYLLVGLLVHRLGDRALLAATVALAAAGVLVQLFVEIPAVGPGRPATFLGGFEDLTHPLRYLRDLFVSGAYPLLPDGAFFLAGMWVGRLRLDRVRTAAGLVVAGVVLLGAGVALPAATGPFADRVGVASLAHDLQDEVGPLTPEALTAYAEQQGMTADDLATMLREEMGADVADLVAAASRPDPSTTAQRLAEATRYVPHDHMPSWLLQATGGGLLVLGAGLLLVRFVPRVGPVLVLGRFALTLYVAHWAFLVSLGDARWVRWHGLATAVLLWLAFAVLAAVYARWRTTGPVEALVRAGGRLAARATDAVRRPREVRLGG